MWLSVFSEYPPKDLYFFSRKDIFTDKKKQLFSISKTDAYTVCCSENGWGTFNIKKFFFYSCGSPDDEPLLMGPLLENVSHVWFRHSNTENIFSDDSSFQCCSIKITTESLMFNKLYSIYFFFILLSKSFCFKPLLLSDFLVHDVFFLHRFFPS